MKTDNFKFFYIVIIVLLVTSNSNAQYFFQITTSKTNTSKHITTIDSPFTNGKVDDIVVVTPVFGKYIESAVGVWYSNNKWNIYTEDKSTMPIGAKFNIMVVLKGEKAFTMSAKTNPNNNNWLSKSIAKNEGVYIVTHKYGTTGYNKSPVGAYVHNNKLIVYNEFKKPIPPGMEFNVVVVDKLDKGRSFIHRNADLPGGHLTAMTNTNASDKNKLIFTTVSLEIPGTYNNAYTGTWFTNNKWHIFNHRKKRMLKNILFNTYLVEPSERIMVAMTTVVANATGYSVKTANNVLLPFFKNRSTIKYQLKNGFTMFEDDIIIGTASEPVRSRPAPHPKRPDFVTKYDRNGFGEIASTSSPLTAAGEDDACFWQYGVIPYEFDTDYRWTTEEKNRVIATLNRLDRETNLTLIPRNGHGDYLEIQKTDPFPQPIGSSWVGRVGGGQNVVLGVLDEGLVVHEVLHAAGFYHEQCRRDRDSYVRINWANIVDDREHNFEIREDGRPLGPYDFNSIMHYGSMAFGNGSVTISPIGSARSVGRSNWLTDLDVDGVNIIYTLDAVSLTTPPLRTLRRIETTIKKVEAKSGTDACDEVEFFSIMESGPGFHWRPLSRTSGNIHKESGDVEGRLILPNWKHVGVLEAGKNEAKVFIRIREDDDAFCGGGDDLVDLNPLNGLYDLELTINTGTGEIYIYDSRIGEKTDYVGQIGSDVKLQGFEKLDFDGDESIPVHITFRIDITN